MAKLNRERRLRERRVEKQVKKDLRKRAAADQADQAVQREGAAGLGDAPPEPAG